MSRYFVPISEADLKAKMQKAYEKSGEFPFLTEQIRKDLEKISFDLENTTNPFEDSPEYPPYTFGSHEKLVGFNTLTNGFTFYLGAAGGDWQIPCSFIVYWDGKSLRGYVPELGNPYNTKTKTAYGDDEESDLKNIKDRFGLELNSVEDLDKIPGSADLIILDITQRIVPKGTVNKIDKSDNRSYAEKFESLKFYIPGDEAEELFDATCSLAYQANSIDSEERVEYLYKWAQEQCENSYKWASENEPERLDDFKMGSWSY